MRNDRVEKTADKFLAEQAQMLGLGPTLQFPDGKVSEEDQGELKAGVTTMGGLIVVNFGTNLSWLSMTAMDARAFATVLLRLAEALELGEGDAANQDG